MTRDARTPALERGSGPDFAALAAKGMVFSHWSAQFGEAPCILSDAGDRTFAELNANANRLLSFLSGHGVVRGDAVALVCPNVPQFVEAVLAGQRGGLRLVPINWHLSPPELDYILGDCGATAWIAHARFGEAFASVASPRPAVRLAIGGSIPGFRDYAESIAPAPAHNPVRPVLGNAMLYTSGTTGKPKGVVRNAGIPIPPLREGTAADYRDGDRNLLTGPAYHAGPLTFDITFPLASGAGIVMMDRFDPEEALALIERYRVTHTHMVSTMFRRLLTLPASVRDGYDLSSLRIVYHGAAPTPPDVKLAMIDWLGPILWEYYGATEATPGINITSEEWLRKRGSVGKVPDGDVVRIIADDGTICPPGVSGRICYFNNPNAQVRYYRAEEKNREVFGEQYYTIGDIGYVDEDGYLFLTGRSAETIISGGVNIYPQEIDNVMARHPAVRQSCAVGVPNDEWGEEVRLVVSLAPGHQPSDLLRDDLLNFARAQLTGYKCPRNVDFVELIPESAAGKTLRAKVRAPYWAGRDRSI